MLNSTGGGMEIIMKKVIIFSLIMALLFSFGACTTEPAQSPVPNVSVPASEQPSPGPNEQPAEKIDINIAALKGPTAIGMIKLIDDAENGETANNYSITLAGSPDEITGSIVQGNFDIAAVPTNLAANLYAKTGGGIKMAALNTMGVLYLVQRGDEIQSVADLEGKTIYSSGAGSVPEFAFNFIIESNGLTPGENVTVEYMNEHSEVASQLTAGMVDYAVLPQPFVTSVLNTNEDITVALDLTEEWEAAEADGGLTMGCVIVNAEFLENNREAVDAFLEEYRASVEFVTNPDNIDEAARLVVENEIIAKQPIAVKAIPECNIVFIDGEEMRSIAGGFFKVLYDANPQSVGGALPDEGLYYID